MERRDVQRATAPEGLHLWGVRPAPPSEVGQSAGVRQPRAVTWLPGAPLLRGVRRFAALTAWTTSRSSTSSGAELKKKEEEEEEERKLELGGRGARRQAGGRV